MKHLQLLSAGRILILALCLTGSLITARAQETDAELTSVILHRDSLFWQAFNSCDSTAMVPFLAEDMEFYHDHGGLQKGRVTFLGVTKHNLCSNPSVFSMRREVVEGSTKVFPLRNGNVMYGAIFSGEHVFYVRENGQAERLDGLAKFTTVWLLQDGQWKMARLLSYDHGPAPYINKRKAITVSNATLHTYAGKYTGKMTGTVEVRADSGRLALVTNNGNMTLYPETNNRFFSKERDLTFEFSKEGSSPMKLTVREHGDVAEELIRQ